MLKTRPDISKKSKSCNLDPTSRKQKSERSRWKQKRPTQNLYSNTKAGFCPVGLTRWRLCSRIHYLFGRLLLFHTIPNYYIYYLPAKPLHYALKATLFSCMNTHERAQGEEVGEGGRSHGQRGQSFGKSLFTWLAACSSSFPSPTTTYVMLAPKRETIRSKQLSLPGDKQTGFDKFLEKETYTVVEKRW